MRVRAIQTGPAALAASTPRSAAGHGGFTLWELLIVLGIIGLLTAMSMPAIKGLKRSNVIADANQQLLDDLAYARLRAIKDRTTVHVVFVPPGVTNMPGLPNTRLARRLQGNQYRAYALFAERTAGDQPGRPFYRYLTDWKVLPEGVLIAQHNFVDVRAALWDPKFNPQLRPFEYLDFPFPTSTNDFQHLPHVAFDSQGNLIFRTQPVRSYPDQYIWLTTGSILAVRDDNDRLISYDFMEKPPGNWLNNTNRIRINGWTGRARVERRDIQ